MNSLLCQCDPKRSRFSLPNDILKWKLKLQAFAILADLCYLHVHCKKDVPLSADEIASKLDTGKDMAAVQIAEFNCPVGPKHGSGTREHRQKFFLSAQ